MFAGGTFLEIFAERTGAAGDDGAARPPATHGHAARDGRAGGDVPVEALLPGDRVLVRQGDVVAVDGRAPAAAVLEPSTLTGEAMPVRLPAGAAVLSGSHQYGRGLRPARRTPRRREHLRRHRPAGRAGAGQPKAPMARLADR